MVLRDCALLFALLLALLLVFAGCEGQGTGGDGLVIRFKPVPECVAIGNPFPSLPHL